MANPPDLVCKKRVEVMAVPAEAVGDEASTEAADHSTNGEDGNCDGEDDFFPSLGDVLIVAFRVRLADETFNHLGKFKKALVIPLFT